MVLCFGQSFLKISVNRLRPRENNRSVSQAHGWKNPVWGTRSTEHTFLVWAVQIKFTQAIYEKAPSK